MVTLGYTRYKEGKFSPIAVNVYKYFPYHSIGKLLKPSSASLAQIAVVYFIKGLSKLRVDNAYLLGKSIDTIKTTL